MEDWRSDEPKNSFFWKKPTKNVVELNPDGTPVERVRGPIENFPPMAIWTPMSRITEQWATGVQLTPCADFELDFHKCSSRVGAVLAKEKCKEFHEDLMECVYHTKSKKRAEIMRHHRRSQGLGYAEKPPTDSFNYY